jgi:hypothetical protein
LCAEEDCNDDIEQDIISWFRSTGWYVEEKLHEDWTISQLAGFDVMMCTDETLACKPSTNSPVYFAHKKLGKHFMEISDYRYSHAAFKFNYINNPYSLLMRSDSIYDTNGDIIMEIFTDKVKVFYGEEKMSINPDYRLEDEVMDVADVNSDDGRSTLFKVHKSDDQGRYSYVGWFYQATPSDLTSDGIQVLNRTALWTYCGDECLTDPNRNFPPVAVSQITPHPLGYVDQVIEYDASESYDPEEQTLTYYWDFGDGTNSGWISNPVTTHTYTDPGDYNVTLTVNDGVLDSEPVTTTLKIKPGIQNAVAFVCAKDSCEDETEQDLIQFMENNGYYVTGKSEDSWTSEELDNYDFMICSDALTGCNIHSWTDPYDEHLDEGMGFLEISDYRYLRAANRFNYINWWIGYETSSSQIRVVNNDDDITEGYSGTVQISDNPSEMTGIFHRNLDTSVNLADVTDKDASTMFKVDASDNRGRYVFIGWFYKRPTSDLTQDGRILLLRTMRWVQCGNVDSCS